MTTLQLSLLPPDSLTSSPPVSPVKTLPKVTPTGEGWKVNALGFSTKSCVLLATLSPNSCYWKTSQGCLTEDLATFSVNWPESGLMRNGVAYGHRSWERRTPVSDCSLLPTPLSQGRLGIKAQPKPNQTKHLSAVILGGSKTHTLNPQFLLWMQGYPKDWLPSYAESSVTP